MFHLCSPKLFIRGRTERLPPCEFRSAAPVDLPIARSKKPEADNIRGKKAFKADVDQKSRARDLVKGPPFHNSLSRTGMEAHGVNVFLRILDSICSLFGG